MGPTNIKFVGSPCGQHGPYTFYKAFRFKRGSKTNILSLGEFFFIKIFKDVEVCIGELQLLWEDRYNPGCYLAMVRLYFLPEQTPDGRKFHHGEDEVLMESDKVPLLVEDLVSLLAADVEWTTGSQVTSSVLSSSNNPATDLMTTFRLTNKTLDMRDIQRERKLIGEKNEDRLGCQVAILNYTQYCRLRAITQRLSGSHQASLLCSVVVEAIGGLHTLSPHTRVLFCRDMFEHPVIQEHDLRQDHLAPNLRGRPKKKRMNFRKYEKDHVYSNESDSNSDSLSSSDRSSSRSTPQKMKEKSSPIGRGQGSPVGRGQVSPVGRGQGSPVSIRGDKSRTAIKPVPIKTELKHSKRKVGLILRDQRQQKEEDSIDISVFRPRSDCSKEETRFLKKLGLFMKKSHVKLTKLPRLGFKPVDVYQFWMITTKLGGYEQVTEKRKWKHIYDKLGGSVGNTSAATCTRRHYEKLLLGYERYTGETGSHRQPRSDNTENDSNHIHSGLVRTKIKDLVMKEPLKEVKAENSPDDPPRDVPPPVRPTTTPRDIPPPLKPNTATSQPIPPTPPPITSTIITQAPPSSHMTTRPVNHLPSQVKAPQGGAPVNKTSTNLSPETMKLLRPALQNVMLQPPHAHIDKPGGATQPPPHTHKPGVATKTPQPAHIPRKWAEPPRMFPTGPVAHCMLYKATQTGPPRVAFLNPCPRLTLRSGKSSVYGPPFSRTATVGVPNDPVVQMKRCISLGKANVNLTTPPPAHCNPTQQPQPCPPHPKKRSLHLPTAAAKTYKSPGPTQPKKPRLVSDYLTLQQPKNAVQLSNAPPKNPFISGGLKSGNLIQTGVSGLNNGPLIQTGVPGLNSGSLIQTAVSGLNSGPLVQTGVSGLNNGMLLQTGVPGLNNGSLVQTGVSGLNSGPLVQTGVAGLNSGSFIQTGVPVNNNIQHLVNSVIQQGGIRASVNQAGIRAAINQAGIQAVVNQAGIRAAVNQAGIRAAFNQANLRLPGTQISLRASVPPTGVLTPGNQALLQAACSQAPGSVVQLPMISPTQSVYSVAHPPPLAHNQPPTAHTNNIYHKPIPTTTRITGTSQLSNQTGVMGTSQLSTQIKLTGTSITSKDGKPIDFSARPTIQAKNSGRIDSPIVISPAPAGEEPVNLSVTQSNKISGVMAPPSQLMLQAATNELLSKLSPPPSIMVALPNNMVSGARSLPAVLSSSSITANQPGQPIPRVVTPKTGDQPPLSPFVHPAFINGTTIQPQILLQGQVAPPSQMVSPATSRQIAFTPCASPGGAISPPTNVKGVSIAMVPYMIPLQQMSQLYSQSQPVITTVTGSLQSNNKP